jgi:hypothetical protein
VTGLLLKVARRLLDCVVVAQLWCVAGCLEVVLRRRPIAELAAPWAAAAASPLGRHLPVGGRLLGRRRQDRLADIAAGWWRPGRDCLPRTMLRWWIALATDPGVDAVLVVGVRRDASLPFSAHAWLMVDGHVRGERQDPAATFEELIRYDRHGRAVRAVRPLRAEAAMQGARAAGGAGGAGSADGTSDGTR